ncbi:MAG TPA: hypothetical protein VGW38_18470 [Chloroflexota bacterium]|nr:hypothetical protein [Chloroflexota bacterium]
MEVVPVPQPALSLGVTGILEYADDVEAARDHLERIGFTPDQVTVLTREGARTGAIRRRQHVRLAVLTMAGSLLGGLSAAVIAWLLGVAGPLLLLVSGGGETGIRPGAVAVPVSILLVGMIIGGLYGALMGIDGLTTDRTWGDPPRSTLLMVHARTAAEAWDARAILHLHGGKHIVSYQIDAGTDEIVGVGLGAYGAGGSGGLGGFSTFRKAA